MMDYRLIAEKDEYALIQRGNDMQQYAVVNGLDKDKGEWNYTCTYYDAGKYSKLSEEKALFKALDAFRSKTDKNYIPHERLWEIATLLKDGLVEDGADEAYEYMCGTVELLEKEAEALGLDMVEYRRKAEPDSNLVLIDNAEDLELARSGLRFENAEFTRSGVVVAKVRVAARRRKRVFHDGKV